MKIESSPKIIPAADSQLKKSENNPSQKPFGQILAETVKTATSPKKEINVPSAVSAITPLQFELAQSKVNRSDIASKLEQLLDLLDQYRMNLENPRIALKDIAPLTQEMETKLNDLAPELEKLDQQDPLSPILNETLVTATLEVRKFGNGWYNPL